MNNEHCLRRPGYNFFSRKLKYAEFIVNVKFYFPG